MPAEDLAVKATQVLNVTKFVPYPFQPVLDNFTTAGTEFFPKDPWDLLQEGSFNKDVQMMMGNAKYEGLVFMKEFLATEDKGKKRLKEMFSDPDIKVPMYMNLR